MRNLLRIHLHAMHGVHHLVHHRAFKRAHESSHIIYLLAAIADTRLLHSASIFVLVLFTAVDVIGMEKEKAELQE